MGNAAERRADARIRRTRLVVAVALASVAAAAPGCRKDREPGAAGVQPAGEAPAPAAAPAAPVEKPAHAVQIPWMSDDWAGALARARQEKKPIFVDMWAPWCHTCLSMKHLVMVDPSLAPYVDRFVWLEIDTDRPGNADLLTRLKISVWPTFYVVSPEKEAVEARHLGAASVTQLRALLDQGEAGHLDAMAAAGALDAKSPVGLARTGDRAAAAGDHAQSAKAYAAALAAAPADWPRIADVLVKQIAALAQSGDLTGCAELGLKEIERAALGNTASVTDFSYYADQCAEPLAPAKAKALRQKLVETVQKALDAPDAALSLDDRSDALARLRELADEMGDKAQARAQAERQRDLLDRAAAEAPNPMARMTYNWQRAEVHVYLGEGEKIIPALEKSVAELPKEYDPPYRLAWVHAQIGKPDQALEWADRALPLVYGPRKGKLLTLIADIQKARGDVEAERAARKAVVDHYAGLPEGQKSEEAEAAAVKALAEVGKRPKSARK